MQFEKICRPKNAKECLKCHNFLFWIIQTWKILFEGFWAKIDSKLFIFFFWKFVKIFLKIYLLFLSQKNWGNFFLYFVYIFFFWFSFFFILYKFYLFNGTLHENEFWLKNSLTRFLFEAGVKSYNISRAKISMLPLLKRYTLCIFKILFINVLNQI